MGKALVVVDVQEDFLRNTLDYIAPLCQRYINSSAGEYDAIILSHWVYDEIKGQNTLLLSHPNAVVIEKSGYSALTEQTRKILEDKKIDEVHVAGVDTEGGVMATMFSLLDAGYKVKVLERLASSYHGRNWEAMMIIRHVLGNDNVLTNGGGPVYF